MVLLLAFSLLLTPLADRLPVERLAEACGRRRGAVLLPAVPVALISALLGLEESFAGWSRWAYLLFFVYGYVLAADDRFRSAMRRDAPLAAALGLALFVTGLPGFLLADDPFTDMTAVAIATRTLYGTAGWCWLVAILGLLDRRGPSSPARDTRPRRIYAYLAVAALPLYVLHQPIVVAVAYGVVGWSAPMAVKYLTIAAASLALTVVSYDLLVRRARVTRFLFGMRG
ncbi:acyltransferase family protein [Streptomyces sp. NPDC054841]